MSEQKNKFEAMLEKLNNDIKLIINVFESCVIISPCLNEAFIKVLQIVNC